MNLQEWEAWCDRRSEYMLRAWRENPQWRERAREQALKRQALGEFRYRKYLAADIERCKRLYCSGTPMPELLRETRMSRSTVFRFCKGLRRRGIRRDWSKR